MGPKHVSLLLAIAVLVPGIASVAAGDQAEINRLSETWDGTLLDANCKAIAESTREDAALTHPSESGAASQESEARPRSKDPVRTLGYESARSYEACQVSSTTTAFVLLAGGKLWRLDESGNDRARRELQTRKKADKRKAVLASITGVAERGVIRVSSLKVP